MTRTIAWHAAAIAAGAAATLGLKAVRRAAVELHDDAAIFYFLGLIAAALLLPLLLRPLLRRDEPRDWTPFAAPLLLAALLVSFRGTFEGVLVLFAAAVVAEWSAVCGLIAAEENVRVMRRRGLIAATAVFAGFVALGAGAMIVFFE